MKKNKDKNNYEDYNETLSVLPYDQLVRKLCGKEKTLEDEYMNNDTKEPKKKLLNTLDSGNTPFDI